MVTLQDLKNMVDEMITLAKVEPSKVKIKFRTFDDQFEENADEFQLPDTITGVDFDIKNWDKATITIERNTKHEKV